MRAERGPVLRVLGAVLAAHADAQHHGHLQQAAAHGLPLRQLVEDLVTRAAHEVAVHQFGDGPAAFHGHTDGGADDSGLGYGRVEEPMIGERFGQAAVDGESAAPVAVFLAVGHDAGVIVEVVQHALENGLAKGHRLGALEFLAIFADAAARLLGNLLHAGIFFNGKQDIVLALESGQFYLLIGEHHLRHALVRCEHHARRGFFADGEFAGLGDLAGGVCADFLEFAFGNHLGFDELGAEFDQRVDGFPQLDFITFAIGRLVGGRMPALAVAQHVKQDGPLVFRDEFLLAAVGLGEGERVIAVHDFGVHVVGVECGAHAGEPVESCRLADGLAAHAVEIVHEIVDDGEAAPVVLVPEAVVLGHGREIEGFPDGPAMDGGVADVGHGDAGLLAGLSVERRAGGDVGAAADDGVGRVDAEGDEEGVHAAAHALVESVLAAEDFGEQAVEQEVDAEFLFFGGGEEGLLLAFRLEAQAGPVGFVVLHDLENGAVPVALDNRHEARTREVLHGAESLGDDLAVAAVAAEDVVLDAEIHAFADGGAFLADGQVRGPGVGILDALVAAELLDVVEHRLEFADYRHVAVNAQAGFLGNG